MAIIYSYPVAVPTVSDLLVGTQIGGDVMSTKSFGIGSIVSLAVDAVTASGASGIFETNSNDNWEITVVGGLITKMEIIG